MDKRTRDDMEAIAGLVAKFDRMASPVGGFMRWPEPTEEEREFLRRVLKDAGIINLEKPHG